MLVNSIQLAWHFYLQEKRMLHYRYMRWTNMLLMIFIVTLSQTSHTVQSFLADNLANLLGADLVLIQQQPLNSTQLAHLDNMSQKRVMTLSIITTLTHHGKWQKAKLKAVGEDYPLQGKLVVANSLQAEGESTLSGPRPGQIWLDSRLLSSLEISVGDSLNLADRSLAVTKILMHEPDRLMEGHSVDMRAMVNLADINALGMPIDLIQHRYLFEANLNQINQLLEWQKTQLPAARVHHKTGAHPLALFWQRVENFIGLASILLFFMSAIAIEKLTQLQIQKEQYFSAICMSLGASKTTGLQVSLFKWTLGFIFSIPIVLIVAAFFHWLLVTWLGSTFTDISWHWDMVLGIKSVISVRTDTAAVPSPSLDRDNA